MRWRKAPKKQPRNVKAYLRNKAWKKWQLRIKRQAQQQARRDEKAQALRQQADAFISSGEGTTAILRFQAYVQADKHRLGKVSFKSYKRMATEALGTSQLDSVARRLMNIHFPEVADSITQANSRRQARVPKIHHSKHRQPKQEKFIEYMRARKHLKGTVGMKSFAEVGRDLGSSAKSVGAWMRRHFPTIYGKRQRLA